MELFSTIFSPVKSERHPSITILALDSTVDKTHLLTCAKVLFGTSKVVAIKMLSVQRCIAKVMRKLDLVGRRSPSYLARCALEIRRRPGAGLLDLAFLITFAVHLRRVA